MKCQVGTLSATNIMRKVYCLHPSVHSVFFEARYTQFSPCRAHVLKMEADGTDWPQNCDNRKLK